MELLGRVAEAAAEDGPPLVDLGRGNPDVGPPAHVVEALRESVLDDRVHGYSPIRGLRRCREAIAARYASEYGVELDPDTEVAIVPGTKTALAELPLVLAEEGEAVLLPDPYYPDYPSGHRADGRTPRDRRARPGSRLRPRSGCRATCRRRST